MAEHPGPMLTPKERLSRFLENRVANLKKQNIDSCQQPFISSENEQFDRITRAFGIQRLLDATTMSEDEEMDESFLEVKRPITLHYLHARGLLSFNDHNLVFEDFNFNFRDLNEHVNKL